MGLRSKLKKLAKKLTPKPLRRIAGQAFDTMFDPKAAFKTAKKQTKSTIRAPGKWMKPKMPEAPAVIEQPDEEELRRSNARRLAGRRGARSNSVLSDNTLG